MENLVRIKYFCCEGRIVVRLIENPNNYYDSLEYYDPISEGWIPSREWYRDMFVDKKVNFREISIDEAIKFVKNSKEYLKRINGNNLTYFRLIYGLDLELLDNKTGKWKEDINDKWYRKKEEYERVSDEEVKSYIDNLFSKKKTR